jgi:hypothetical protein
MCAPSRSKTRGHVGGLGSVAAAGVVAGVVAEVVAAEVLGVVPAADACSVLLGAVPLTRLTATITTNNNLTFFIDPTRERLFQISKIVFKFREEILGPALSQLTRTPQIILRHIPPTRSDNRQIIDQGQPQHLGNLPSVAVGFLLEFRRGESSDSHGRWKIREAVARPLRYLQRSGHAGLKPDAYVVNGEGKTKDRSKTKGRSKTRGGSKTKGEGRTKGESKVSGGRRLEGEGNGESLSFLRR